MPAMRPAVLFPWRCSRCIGLDRQPAQLQHVWTSTRSASTTASESTKSSQWTRPARALKAKRRVSQSLNNEALNLTASARIKPESPRYVDVPTPLQAQAPQHPHLKGTLPVPRDIFPAKDPSALAKASQARLAALAQEHRRERNPRGVSAPQAAHNAWRTRVAAQRRSSLAAGLAALASRARRRQHAVEAKQAAAAREREALLESSDRADEILTRPSVLAAMAATLADKSSARLPDPTRAARLAAKSANVAAHAAAKRDAARADLHELYMRARGFIVTEAALDAALDEEFGSPDAPRAWRDRPSVWAEGPPPSLARLALEARGRADGRSGSGDAREALMLERLRRVAGELTGGKM